MRTWLQGPLFRRLAVPLGLFLVVPGCDRPGAPPAPCVLLVTLDTVSADRVGAWGSPDARTAHLDRHARRGWQFRDAISPAPLTAPSHATILTGRIPPVHGIRENGGFTLREDIRTVAERLPREVRRAAFIAAAPLLGGSGLERGFDPYDDDLGTGPDGRPRAERPASEVLARAGAWLAERRDREPVFGWIHLFDPHYPWEAPAPWPRVAPDDAAGAHGAEIAALDRALGRFHRAVERPAVLILASDHGESLGAHGEITHGFFVYDTTQRVPLIVSGPGIRPRLDPGPRSLAGIAPYVLGCFGVPATAEDPPSLGDPAPDFQYLESLHPEILYGYRAVFAARSPRWKFIEAPRAELYDLVADPAEADNRLAAEPAVAESLRAWLQAHRDRHDSPAARPLDPAQAERLRALGYVAASGPARGGGSALPDAKDGIAVVRDVFLGLDALRRGDPAAAIGFLEAAAAAAPGDRETHHHLARARLALGDAEGAAREARTALDLRPPTSEAELRAILGEALLASGLPAEALPHLQLAARARPSDERVRATLEEAQRLLR